MRARCITSTLTAACLPLWGAWAHAQVQVQVQVQAQSASPLRQTLDGQRIAYPIPNAFGASLYVRALLEREHQVKKKADYGTPTNAYRHVITDQAMAAGGVMATLSSEPPAIGSQLRVLYQPLERLALKRYVVLQDKP
jgi:hypothetical protein